MPDKPWRPCGKQGCPNLTKERFCDEHAHMANQYDKERGSAAKRGYGRRWQTYTERFLRQPENAFCACGCGGLATEVDHITPINGPDDPLFWKRSNHQGLTHECHSRKTAEDRKKGLTRTAGR